MNALKYGLLTLTVLIVSVIAYVYVSFGYDYQLDQALAAFQRGETQEALEQIQAIENQGLDLRDYRIYLALDRGDLVSAEQELSANSLLPRALVAILKEDHAALQEVLAELPQDAYPLLSAAERMLAGDFATAHTLLEHSSFDSLADPWFAQAARDCFGENWIDLSRVRCLIEAKEWAAVDIELAQLLEEARGGALTDAHFLRGFASIRQASSRPLKLRPHYYEMALQDLERIPPRHPGFVAERAEIVALAQNSALELLREDRAGEATSLIRFLVGWREEAATHAVLSEINTHFSTALQQQDWKRAAALALWSRELDTPDPVAERIEGVLLLKIERALETGDLTDLSHYWEVLKAVAANALELSDRLASRMETEVLRRFEEDDVNLTRTRPYVVFWSLIERDNVERYAFSKRLVTLAGAIWVRRDAGERSLALMKLAEDLPYLTERAAFQEHLETTLRVVYQTAVHRDAVEKLGPLFEAVQYFHIPSIDLQEPHETANQIEDVRFLYSSQRYREAWRRIRLLEIVAPADGRVKRLSGLVATRQGRFREALAKLRPMLNGDPEVRAALAVSEIAAGDVAVGKTLIQQVGGHTFFDSYTRTLVGYLLLEHHEYALAEQWLYSIADSEPLARIGLACAASQQGRWSEALGHLRKIEEPFNQLQALQLLSAYSLMKTGAEEAGRRAAENTAARTQWPDVSGFPDWYLRVEAQTLSQLKQSTL